MADKYMKHLRAKLKNHPIRLDKYVFDYTRDKTQWSQAKKDKYDHNIWRFFYDPTYNDVVGSFKLMVKAGEVYPLVNDVEKNGFLLNHSARPRAIWNPSEEGCGIMQAI